MPETIQTSPSQVQNAARVMSEKKSKPPTLEGWAEKVEEYNDTTDPDSLPNILKRGNKAGDDAKELKAKAAAARDEADLLREQVAGRERELSDLRSTRTFRYTARLRAIYGRFRRPIRGDA